MRGDSRVRRAEKSARRVFHKRVKLMNAKICTVLSAVLIAGGVFLDLGSSARSDDKEIGR